MVSKVIPAAMATVLNLERINGTPPIEVFFSIQLVHLSDRIRESTVFEIFFFFNSDVVSVMNRIINYQPMVCTSI